MHVIIYHHPCTDGFAAAWCAYKKLGLNNVQYIPADHTFKLEDLPDLSNKHVYMFDIAFERDVMLEIIQTAESFILYDHHLTSFKSLADLPNCNFNMNLSGAQLAWDYFFPETQRPLFIDYVGDYDLHNFKMPFSKEFSATIYNAPFDFEQYNMFNSDEAVINAIAKGKNIMIENERYIEHTLKNVQYSKFEFEGNCLQVASVESDRCVSGIGLKLSEDNNIDLAIVFYQVKMLNGQIKNKASLRSIKNHIDVGMIAQNFGGGGHKYASSFYFNKMSDIDLIK